MITKNSANVYWLKLVRKVVEKNGDLAKKIVVEIVELPGTVFGDMLRLDNTHITLNMTVLTELCEFDSSS